jgi:hypothetical protein
MYEDLFALEPNTTVVTFITQPNNPNTENQENVRPVNIEVDITSDRVTSLEQARVCNQ